MNGRAPGFASFVLYLPREQLTVVVFSNIYSSATSTIGNDIAAISVDRSYGPFHPSEQPPSESELKASTGTFRFSPDFYQTNAQITLFLNGTEFGMRWPSGDISPLLPLSKDRFIDRSYWQEVRIERDAAGNPATLWYDRFQGKSDHSSGPGWILTWSDEFSQTDGSPPDPNKWQIEAGGNGWGNDELEYYTSRPQNLEVRSGNLEMTAVKERYTGPDGVTRGYTSARLKTMGKFEQAYGRFEAGIKIPYGQGIWPAFWMLGNDSETAGWPSCGEIGIMENIGREPAIVHGTIHGPGYFGANGIGSSYSLPTGRFADEFHIYAVEWGPSQIRFYVDDHLYATRVPTDLPPGTKWVYDHPFYVILDLAVGGGWPGNPDNSTVFPQKMLIDYVRAYKQSNH
jgi:beta-glucanase (GH16 family)